MAGTAGLLLPYPIVLGKLWPRGLLVAVERLEACSAGQAIQVIWPVQSAPNYSASQKGVLDDMRERSLLLSRALAFAHPDFSYAWVR